ncbi:NAD(P)-binding domain-containing protein [Ramlibacter sp.]|uniref:NAD(P)-binding domain-containing protein n=1 Tax=Ramlibacter sp. TaxID=1917967 RepID=UPI003D0BD9ED
MQSPSSLPPVPPQSVASPRDAAALDSLAATARTQLALLNFPVANWVVPASGPQGEAALDVLVAGAGMCGQTAGYALLREGVTNIRVIDREPRGDEGPWATYARMLTLRSAKHLTGPDLGVPALTFRAWYEAQHGAQGWAALHKIGRIDWRDYLLWVRETVGLRVDNGTELIDVENVGELLRVRLRSAAGEETAWTRKLVLAFGRDGSGAPRWPAFPSLSRDASFGRVFHSADAIDFDAWRGRRVAVLGAGASAFDNAACALEAGAGVTLFARREHLPQVNKNKWATFTGFLRGYEALDDARKWRFHTYIFDEQVPPPWETVRRCDDHASFALRLGEPWRDVAPDSSGVLVTTDKSAERFDAVIFGTGFDVDLVDRPELWRYVKDIDTWRNHVTPQQALAHPDSARFPYLGAGFEMRGIGGASANALSRIHLFNWGGTMSQAALAGDIPGLHVGARRLAESISRDLFVADADAHWARLQAHDEPELIATKRYVPPEERG